MFLFTAQQLAESLTLGNVTDAKRLVDLLANLIPNMSLKPTTTDVLGSFSMSYQVGSKSLEKKFR